jgi:hypothetical protein
MTSFFGAKLSRNNYSTSTDANQPAGTETKQTTNDKPRFNNNRNDRQFNRNDRPYQNRNQDQHRRFGNNNERNTGFKKFNNNRNENNNRVDNNNNQSQPANPTPEQSASTQPQTAPSSENKDSYLGIVGERQRKNFVANRQRPDSNQQMRSDRHQHNFQHRSNNHNNGPQSGENRSKPFQHRPRHQPPRDNNTGENNSNNAEAAQPRAKLLNAHRNKANTEEIVKKQFKVEHPAAPVVIHPANITITSAEKKVFDILAETVKHFKLDTVLRVAGGWVRDKILGNDAGDIDIAVDNLTGVDFATLVQNYLKNHGDEQNLRKLH